MGHDKKQQYMLTVQTQTVQSSIKHKIETLFSLNLLLSSFTPVLMVNHNQ